MKKFKCNKLVRDEIPRIFKECSIECSPITLDNESYVIELKRKVVEEAKEVLDAKTTEELIEEIGDLQEVIQSLINALNLDNEKIKQVREEKKRAKGGFSDRLYIDTFSIPLESEHIQHFLEKADKYPQVK